MNIIIFGELISEKLDLWSKILIFTTYWIRKKKNYLALNNWLIIAVKKKEKKYFWKSTCLVCDIKLLFNRKHYGINNCFLTVCLSSPTDWLCKLLPGICVVFLLSNADTEVVQNKKIKQKCLIFRIKSKLSELPKTPCRNFSNFFLKRQDQ